MEGGQLAELPWKSGSYDNRGQPKQKQLQLTFVLQLAFHLFTLNT